MDVCPLRHSVSLGTGSKYPNNCNQTDTFLRSCGSLTVTETETLGGDPFCTALNCASQKTSCNKNKLTTYGNVCQSNPLLINGKSMGEVIYVLQDCETRHALQKGQRESYYYPGVSGDEQFLPLWPVPPEYLKIDPQYLLKPDSK